MKSSDSTAESNHVELVDALAKLRVNPDWASLPLLDRTGWTRLPFGAFAENVNERVDPSDAADEAYVGLEHLDSGSLHVRRWGTGADVIGTKLRFRKGDVIFGRRRAYQRKLAVAEFDGICSAHAMVVRAKEGFVLPEFLPFLMMSDRFMNRAIEISVGSLSPTINWTTLKTEQFDLPPLEHQQQIQNVITGVDKAGESANRDRDATLTLRKTAHSEVFAQGLNRSERRKNGELPSRWRDSTVRQDCRIENHLRRPINAADRANMSGEYPYYGPTGILDHLNEYRIDGDYVLLGEDGDHFLKFDVWNMTQFGMLSARKPSI